jgi:hypothetical protein
MRLDDAHVHIVAFINVIGFYNKIQWMFEIFIEKSQTFFYDLLNNIQNISNIAQ